MLGKTVEAEAAMGAMEARVGVVVRAGVGDSAPTLLAGLLGSGAILHLRNGVYR